MDWAVALNCLLILDALTAVLLYRVDDIRLFYENDVGFFWAVLIASLNPERLLRRV